MVARTSSDMSSMSEEEEYTVLEKLIEFLQPWKELQALNKKYSSSSMNGGNSFVQEAAPVMRKYQKLFEELEICVSHNQQTPMNSRQNNSITLAEISNIYKIMKALRADDAFAFAESLAVSVNPRHIRVLLHRSNQYWLLLDCVRCRVGSFNAVETEDEAWSNLGNKKASPWIRVGPWSQQVQVQFYWCPISGKLGQLLAGNTSTDPFTSKDYGNFFVLLHTLCLAHLQKGCEVFKTPFGRSIGWLALQKVKWQIIHFALGCAGYVAVLMWLTYEMQRSYQAADPASLNGCIPFHLQHDGYLKAHLAMLSVALASFAKIASFICESIMLFRLGDLGWLCEFYFSSPWDVFWILSDVATFAIMLRALIAFWACEESFFATHPDLLVVVILIKWSHFLMCLCIFPWFGSAVLPAFQAIISDASLVFVICVCVLLLGSVHAYYSFPSVSLGLQGALLQIYQMNVLGDDSEFVRENNSHEWTGDGFIVACSFLSLIVFLNVYIGILATAYDRFAKDPQNTYITWLATYSRVYYLRFAFFMDIKERLFKSCTGRQAEREEVSEQGVWIALRTPKERTRIEEMDEQ